MKTTPQFQRVIETLCERHGIDIGKPESHLRLVNDPYVPLTVENVGQDRVSVTHYVEQAGELLADPEVVFFVGYGPWVPVAVQQLWPGGWRRYAELEESVDGWQITRVAPRAQAGLGRFVNQ